MAVTATRLGFEASEDRIETGIELFDWYASTTRPRGPGFLVDAIRHPDKYHLPPGFEPSARRRERELAADSRNRARREIERRAEANEQANHDTQWRAFTAVWETLSACEQTACERAAVAAAPAIKRDGYRRLQAVGGPVFEQYRRVVLLDHFDRTRVGR